MAAASGDRCCWPAASAWAGCGCGAAAKDAEPLLSSWLGRRRRTVRSCAAELSVLADDVVRLEPEVQLHPEAQSDFDAAVNRYRAAQAALEYADQPVDLVRVARVVAEARYAMDRVRAILDGRDPPPPPEELQRDGPHGEPAVTLDESRQPAYIGYPGGFQGGWFGGTGGGLFSGLLLGSLLGGGFGHWGYGGTTIINQGGDSGDDGDGDGDGGDWGGGDFGGGDFGGGDFGGGDFGGRRLLAARYPGRLIWPWRGYSQASPYLRSITVTDTTPPPVSNDPANDGYDLEIDSEKDAGRDVDDEVREARRDVGDDERTVGKRISDAIEDVIPGDSDNDGH